MRPSLKTVSIAMILALFICSCGSVKNSPKYQLANGYYKSKMFSSKATKVYVNNDEDSIFVYGYNKTKHLLDTSSGARLQYPEQRSGEIKNSKPLRQASFDIDFLTIPFKYRPTQRGFPQQFNTSLNGAVYFGFRNDVYHITYKKSPLKKYDRQINHYGFSFGLFTGIGGTAINPWVTNNVVGYEYDGIAWSKGIGAIIGVNNFTIGLALGFDDLLDSNKDFWIYQQKPWLGLAFGLNIN